MATSNKADPEWKSHKATIESLYVKDHLKLEGRGGLMDTMARSHGFVKSKSQYESHFKIWGMRKYRKKDDWRSVGRKISERKRAGKDSSVYINNEVIPKARVQRQIRRHEFTTTFGQILPASSPRTPDGFEIRTPVAEDSTVFSELQEAAPTLPHGTGTNNFPFAQLQTLSSSLQPWEGTDDFPVSQLQNATSSLPPWTETDDFRFSPLPPVPYLTGPDDFPFIPIEDTMKLVQRWTYTQDLPFFQLEAGLHAQADLPLNPTNAKRPRFGIPLVTSRSLEDHQDIFHQGFDAQHVVLRVSGSLTAVLEALLPSTARVNQPEEGLISSPNNYRLDAATPRLLTHLLFATANNFAGLDGVPIEEIMDYLKRQTNTRLLRQLLSTSGPESEAFAENLFRAAIEAEDARIVEILLEKGLNPDELVCNVGGEKYTPIERSSMIRSVEITRLLLRAKADVNKTVGTKPERGALQCAIGTPYKYYEGSRTPFELVSLLLHAGAKVDALILQALIFEERDQDVFDLLVQFFTKTNPLDLARSWLPAKLTEKFDNKMATRTVMSIFQACLDSAHDMSPTLGSTLDMAAERGNLGLVQFLLHSHVSLTHETLTNAIRSQNKDLIRVLIDAGADVDGDCSISQDIQTPLGAAISWGDVEIIDLLEHKGVWSHVCEGSRFKFALIAASEVGNLAIVQKLLNLGFNVTGIDLGGALQAAICGGHEEIALILLNAGADVNLKANDEYYDKNTVLLEALQQKNEKLVQLILDADVDIHRHGESALRTAVEWGNHSIIEELIATGADPNAYSYGLEDAPLTIAVKRKDTESLQLLLDAGADVNSRGKKSTALKAAVTNGDIEMVEYLFSIGADPDDSEALSEALSQGMPMLETLLTKFTRVYPHGKRGYGCDVLSAAIGKADFRLIECLLDAKIDVNTYVCIGEPERPASWDPLAMH
ncbi:hypothetical protein HO173_008671 [Letharia columbiana]|uniref:Clr5 domain-containing protein n=1 Tax=Letharia columbiana TaxID=112416 RepID=A0A8H6L2I4_9LECA|nr:uncharacterized protein HO173_008671 [Letharia columbiana]KAF6233127.1 hypothetical protein HO173_008671 [Letharia columbiana]